MVARSNPINHQYSNHNEQEQDQDDNRSRNNSYGFLHDNPISLNVRGHVQTSSKTGGVVLAESCNDHQLVSNAANHNQVQVPFFTRIFEFFYQLVVQPIIGK